MKRNPPPFTLRSHKNLSYGGFATSCVKLAGWWVVLAVLTLQQMTPVSAGYTKETLGALVHLLKDCFPEQYPNLRMIEFGSQETHDKKDEHYPIYVEEQFITRTYPTKYFFQHLGLSYQSVDLNGHDGSLKLDCRQDISSYLEQADVLTNIGFSEHVGEGDLKENVFRNQYVFFKNMHDLAKVGALFYHVFMTHFPAHGVAQYSPEFTVEFPKRSNYDLVFEPFENPYRILEEGGGENMLSYIAAYRKMVDEPFMSFEEFESIPGLRNIAYQSDRQKKQLPVHLFPEYTKSGEYEFAFLINQELTEEKTFPEWAEHFCDIYYANTPDSENVFLLNDQYDRVFCDNLVYLHIEQSSIEKMIRS